MEEADGTPRRPLSVRTTSNGAGAANGTPRRPLSVRTTSNGAGAADGSEVPGEPVSPSARLAEDLYIVVLFGLGTPVNISAMRADIGARMASHPRFHSIQTTDKKGIIWWAETTVIMDYHVSCPELDSVDAAANPDQAVEDYVGSYALRVRSQGALIPGTDFQRYSLSTQPMDNSRPLWKFDILNFPTSESASTVVMRVHHSLGDGMSLLTLFLSCTRSAADPTRLPVMPPLPVRTGAVYARPRPPASAGTLAFVRWVWSFAELTWHTAVDVANFFATVLFLKDTQTLFTVMKNDHGELRRKRIVHRSLSLEDVKSVKQAMNCSVNDVLVGVTDAALSRYYYRKSASKKVRLRSILPVNLRPTTSMQACIDMIESGKWSDVKLGNQVGFILLPLHIVMHSDPLDYVREAKNTCDRKKRSLEVAFTHEVAEVFFKLFGPKVGAAIINRMASHTTTSLSNMIGPVEQVEFCGHPIVFFAPTTYIPQEAIVVNYQSYVNTVRVVLAVDDVQFPDCHELLDDFVESLKCIKNATMSHGKNNQKASDQH